jgi:hypothetical protein
MLIIAVVLVVVVMVVVVAVVVVVVVVVVTCADIYETLASSFLGFSIAFLVYRRPYLVL